MSEQHYLVRKADVYQIVWEMFREHQVDMVISLGDAALLGGIHAWTEDTEVDRVHAITADPSPASGGARDKAKVEVEVEENWKTLWGVLTLETARRIIVESAKECARTVGTIALNAAKVRVEQKIGHRLDFETPGEKRWEAFQQRYRFRMQVHRDGALQKLAAVVLKKYSSGRRRGIQILSTRKLSVPFGFSQFCGKPCYRANVGRPPLPESVWLKRYRARRAKQKKTKRTRKPKTTLKVPPTKNPRPKRVMDLKPKRRIGRGSFYDVTEHPTEIAARLMQDIEDIIVV